jgi:hypothetical protein
MSSVLARTKQIPIDSQYFVSLVGAGPIALQIFLPDAAASTTSYVSGAAAGRFSQSNITLLAFDGSGGNTQLFRDMGKDVVSSGRTFRAVQLLTLDGTRNDATHPGGGTGWTSTTGGTPGVWKPSNEGVSGSGTGVAGTTSDFGVFYFETGARGLGIAQGLVRYG